MRVQLEVSGPEALRALLYPDGGLGGVRVDGALPGALGQRCVLRVRVSGPPGALLEAEGQLVWARHRGTHGLPACFGVGFVKEDPGGRAALLRCASLRGPEGALRGARRVGLALRAELLHDGGQDTEVLGDLSEGGAFVRTRLALPVGAPVRLRFRPPGALLRLALEGHVVWRRAAGLGVAFAPGQARARARLARALERLAPR